jgi:uncharacterized protein YcbK (DUF882 family)
VNQISANFWEPEFDCASGEPVPIALLPNLRHLVSAVLQPLRTRFAQPLVVTSGYRSPTYNEAIRLVSDERARRAGLPHGGVAVHSRHMTAEAADIRPSSLAALPRLMGLVEEMLVAGELPALGGLGRYPGWIHVDVRPGQPGAPTRWLGAGVGSEP